MIQRQLDTLRFLATDPIGRARSGQTPHTIVHRQGTAQLRYFAPAVATGRPVFVSMPLINNWTIWDLLPDRSVVARLVRAGHPVYLLDWGKPGPELADRPLDWFVDDLLGRAIRRAARHAGAPLAAAGYCVGGTFLASHMARNDAPLIDRVALVATPIDFHLSGRLARWADPDVFPLDALQGNFPGEDGWMRAVGERYVQADTLGWVVGVLADPDEVDSGLDGDSGDDVDDPGLPSEPGGAGLLRNCDGCAVGTSPTAAWMLWMLGALVVRRRRDG